MKKLLYATGIILPLATMFAYREHKLRQPARWIRVKDDEIILNWLKEEFNNGDLLDIARYHVNEENGYYIPGLDILADDYGDKRKIVFDKYCYWKLINDSTVWYKVEMTVPQDNWLITSGEENIESGEYKQIINIPYPTLVSRLLTNSIDNTILWGHGEKDSLIVLSGNERWSNWMGFKYRATFYIGVSGMKYELHANTGCKICSNE